MTTEVPGGNSEKTPEEKLDETLRMMVDFEYEDEDYPINPEALTVMILDDPTVEKKVFDFLRNEDGDPEMADSRRDDLRLRMIKELRRRLSNK